MRDSAVNVSDERAERYLGPDLFSAAVGDDSVLLQLDDDVSGNDRRNGNIIGDIQNGYAKSETETILDGLYDGQVQIKHDEMLPIFKYKDEILDKLNRNSIIFIHGDTGCGKSTQIPVYIFDQCIRNGEYCNILITQPRRIAASSVASYVAATHQWRLGSVVGYHVSIDRKMTTTKKSSLTSTTRITYCTTGILLQKLIYRPDILERYTHIIFDEVHERSADLDLAIMFMRQLIRPPNPQIKIIVMSATFEATKFWQYMCRGNEGIVCSATGNDETAHRSTVSVENMALPDDVCVTVHSRQYRVELVYLDQIFDALKDYEAKKNKNDSNGLPIINRWGSMEKWVSAMTTLNADDTILYEPKVLLPVLQYAASIVVELEISERRRMKAEQIAGIFPNETSYGKGILIFLPGIEDILTLKAILNQYRKHLRQVCGATLNIVTLHASAVSFAEQMHQFQHAPVRQRRVVLSTNVGESSITLPDIGYVIDLCLTKQLFWDADSAWTSLDVVWASKCSADQRAGRCGRTCDGLAYRLVPEVVYNGTIPDVDIPEVRRAPIHASILRVKAFADSTADETGTLAAPGDFFNMLIDPPSETIVLKSMMYLKQLGALTVLAPDGSSPSHTDGALTALGDACIKLPVDIFITRFIMFAFACNLLDDAVEIAAILASRDTVLMLHRFNSACDDEKNAGGISGNGDEVPTGMLIDFCDDVKSSTHQRDDEPEDDNNDDDDGDFLDIYSHHKRLLVWDDSQHSDTFAFRAAYRVWKRGIRPLTTRRACERACRQLALCHERLEQIFAIETELRKRLRAMRLLSAPGMPSWQCMPNEHAKVLILKMILAAAGAPHFFQITSPDNKIPARTDKDYLDRSRRATLRNASLDLCHRPATSSVLVCLERDIVTKNIVDTVNGISTTVSTTAVRDAKPITIFDADFVRAAFDELFSRLPVQMRIHFIMPLIQHHARANEPIRVMQFVVEFCNLRRGLVSAHAENDGEPNLAVKMLMHRLRLMSRVCSVERNSSNAYRSVHESASGLPTLFLPDVRNLQVEVKTATNIGAPKSVKKFESLENVIHEARLPFLWSIQNNFINMTDEDCSVGRVYEIGNTDLDKSIGALRPAAYDVRAIFQTNQAKFNVDEKITQKLARMPSTQCAVLVTRQQQANAERRDPPVLIENGSVHDVDDDATTIDCGEFDDNFLKPVLPVKLFHMPACDRASVIFTTGLREAHARLYAAYQSAATKIKSVENWLVGMGADVDQADRFDAIRECVIGKCFLYRLAMADEMDRSMPYLLRLISSFYNAMQINNGPKYLRVQVVALDSPESVVVAFLDFGVFETVQLDMLAYLPLFDDDDARSLNSEYNDIWLSVPTLAEQVRLGPARCTNSIHGARPEYLCMWRTLTAMCVCDWLTPTRCDNNIWCTFLQYVDGVYEVDVLLNKKLFDHVGNSAIRDDPPTADMLRDSRSVDSMHACVDLYQCQMLGASYNSIENNNNNNMESDNSFKLTSLSYLLKQYSLAKACTFDIGDAAAIDSLSEADIDAQTFVDQAPVTQRIPLPSRASEPAIYLPTSDGDLIMQYEFRGLRRSGVEAANVANPPLALDWRRISMSIYSPLVIPTNHLHTLHHATLQKPVAISFNSINSVLLTNTAALGNTLHAGRRTEQRMLFATDVSASRSRKTISLRHTTLMPPMPGMLPLVSLLFSPCVELRVNSNLDATGALCGVGSEFTAKNAVRSMDVMHDILVPFDVKFLRDDLQCINQLRRYMSAIIAMPMRYARNDRRKVRENLFYELLTLTLNVGTERMPASERDWDALHFQMTHPRDDGKEAFAWHGVPTRYGSGWQQRLVTEMESSKSVCERWPKRSVVFNATSRAWRRRERVNIHGDNNNGQENKGNCYNGGGSRQQKNDDGRRVVTRRAQEEEWNIQRLEAVLLEFELPPVTKSD